MSINDYLDFVVDCIATHCDDARVTKAYPNCYKPTRLKRPHVSVSFGGEEKIDIGISGYAVQRECKVEINIYVSYEDGLDTLCDLAQRVQDCGVLENSTSFSIAKINNNDNMDTLGLKMTVGYKSYDIN